MHIYLATPMCLYFGTLQGNGHERDFMGCQNVYIMDVYNRLIYPRDEHAKEAINKRVELSPYTEDRRYLEKVEEWVCSSVLLLGVTLLNR